MKTSLNANAAAGHTISDTTKNGASPIDTMHYVLDAEGNIMAVYRNKKIEEQPIYGSTKIGPPQYAGKEKEGYQTFNLRKYELTNHLGNVLAVISDKVNLYGHSNILDSARATIVSASDYYPFGLIMQGRTYQDSVCRYGFNGKRKDNRYGRIAKYNYGFRIYSPEDGVFLSVDPLTSKFSMLTPYQFASNTPIQAIDLDGKEALSAQIELRTLVSGEMAGITTSHTVGILVGASAAGSGVYAARFYTPTLGIGSGAGLTLGASVTVYPTANIEDLGGFGAAAGYFLTKNPAGAGPVFSGEINSTDPSQSDVSIGGTYGVGPLSGGMGGGAYVEGAYTFLSDVVKVADLPNSSFLKGLTETFGVPEKTILEGVNAMVNELSKQNSNLKQQLKPVDLEQEKLIPADKTRFELPKRLTPKGETGEKTKEKK